VAYSGDDPTFQEVNSYFRVDGPRLWIELVLLTHEAPPADAGGDETTPAATLTEPPPVHDHGLWRDKLADYGAAYGTSTIATGVRPPVITQQPVKQTVEAGAPATFSVTAESTGTGTPTLSYQWFKDCHPLPGAIEPQLTIPATKPEDGGLYWVQVISTGGLTRGQKAELEVQLPSSSNRGGPAGRGPRGPFPGPRR
jgi:hypothetical protein